MALVEFGRAPGGLPEEPKTVPQDPQNKNRVAAVTQKPQLNNLPRSQEGGNFRGRLIPQLTSFY